MRYISLNVTGQLKVAQVAAHDGVLHLDDGDVPVFFNRYLDGADWSKFAVTELTTGKAIAFGASVSEAYQNAQRNCAKHGGMAGIQRYIAEWVEKHGELNQ